MLMSTFDKNAAEFIVRGEFFELDKLYFLIERLSGNYGIPPRHYLPEYENAASLLLGLNYEIRKAESGDRELYTAYNGLHFHWFAPAGTPDSQIMTLEEEERNNKRFVDFDDIILFDLDMDPDEFGELDYDRQEELLDDLLSVDSEEAEAYLDWINRGPIYRFRQEEYPEASETNTYLQFRISFAEGVLYAFVIETLLSFRRTIFENAYARTSDSSDPLAEYEMDYCMRRLPYELALLDVLKELLFTQIREVCSREEYLALRKKEAPRDFFRNLSDSKIKELSELLEGKMDASMATVWRVAENIGITF